MMERTKSILSLFILALTIVGLSTIHSGAETLECQLTIEKSVSPQNNNPFDFTVSGTVSDTFTLSVPSDPSETFGLLASAVVNVTEEPTEGWDLADIVCDDAPSGCNGPCLTITIDVATNSLTAECQDSGEGDTRTCTFINQPVPANVPALSTWGIVALVAAIGLIAFAVLRRRKTTA